MRGCDWPRIATSSLTVKSASHKRPSRRSRVTSPAASSPSSSASKLRGSCEGWNGDGLDIKICLCLFRAPRKRCCQIPGWPSAGGAVGGSEGGGTKAASQAFWQAFPNLGCFRPSFSKQIFGRFVGFQGVASLKNLNDVAPNFFWLPPSLQPYSSH